MHAIELASGPFQVWGGRRPATRGLVGTPLLGGAGISSPLNPNPLLLQSQQDPQAQVSGAPKGWLPCPSPPQFGPAPPAALYVNFYTFDLN